MTIEIAPSIMCDSFRHLEDNVRLFERARVAYLHFDIMDGHFVPNFTLGPDIVARVRSMTDLPLDCHLMIEDPDRYAGAFAEAGASLIVVHAEAPVHLDRSLRLVKDLGCRAGVALNPATPVSAIELVAHMADVVLVMCVNPGFAGQKLVPYTIDKIAAVTALLADKNPEAQILVDGNTTFENIRKMAAAGADIVVAGTSCLYMKDKPLDKALEELTAFLASLEK